MQRKRMLTGIQSTVKKTVLLPFKEPYYMQRKRMLTGIQSTAKLHIGNLLGSIMNIGKYKNQECFVFAADLHCFTTMNCVNNNHSIDILRYFHRQMPESYFYIQSDHSSILGYLTWLLSCSTGSGKLMQMTQYKSKKNNNDAGLLFYPLLMAADILVLQPDMVPVGKDQLQHLEFTRDICRSFNNRHNMQLKAPESLLSATPKVYDLKNPEKKMSKSNAPIGTIFLDDTIDDIAYKIRKAQTDSEVTLPVSPEEKRQNIHKLYQLYHYITSIKVKDIYEEFARKQTSVFKHALINALENFLKKHQPVISSGEMLQLISSQKSYINLQMKKCITKIEEKIFINK